MFPLAFSTLGCPELNFSQVLAVARQHGLPAVELRCLSGAPLEPDHFAIALPSPAERRAQLDAAGVATVMLGTSIKLFGAKDADLTTAATFARLADEMNCPWLRIFDGGTYGELPNTYAVADAADWWRRWQDLRRQQGLHADLVIETHDGLVRRAALERLLDALPELNLLWDTHHTWRAGEPLADYHQVARNVIRHVHAKDSINRPSKRKPFTYCKPGDGEFPWEEMKTLLAGSGYTGVVSFEWERHWNPELPALETVLPAFLKMMAPAGDS